MAVISSKEGFMNVWCWSYGYLLVGWFCVGLAGNSNGWIHIIYVGAFRNYIYKYIMK